MFLYEDYFGGVFAISTEHFQLINGFSNRFWGWGSEDTDVRDRILRKGLKITRPEASIAKYRTIPHHQAKENSNRWMIKNKPLDNVDGLNSLNGLYAVKTIKNYYTHTLISVDVNKPNHL